MFEMSRSTKCVGKDDEAKFCEIINKQTNKQTNVSLLWLLMNQIRKLTWQKQQSVIHTEQLQKSFIGISVDSDCTQHCSEHLPTIFRQWIDKINVQNSSTQSIYNPTMKLGIIKSRFA